MKSYLSLIPISAKVHRRQNRLTLLCIIFSVFMVTAIFSMADMGARMEQARLTEKHGIMPFQALFVSTMGQTLLMTAVILFFLVLLAGVLMISGSINSSVTQRIKFFGMMRCIGMSKQQIIHFVRLEALNWCKIAVPVGVSLGTLASWTLCAALRLLVGEEFSQLPLFNISGLGIVSGIIVGVATVLIAAGSPAKRAANVSPMTAASGNCESAQSMHHTIQFRFFRIETVLGFHHAVSAKKNFILMTGSFALTIILFLSFSVLVDFVNHLMPQSSSAPDIEIASNDGANSIDGRIVNTLKEIEGVQQVYGRRSCFEMPVRIISDPIVFRTIDLISFDNFDLDCLAKDHMLTPDSDLQKVYGDSRYVLAVSDPESPWQTGDQILLDGETLEIAGLLQYDPFSDDGLTHGNLTLIVSGETFMRLTGVSNYALVMVQTASDITKENVQVIQDNVNGRYQFRDRREENTAGTYLAFIICVYGFLTIIALVTLLNMVNSISMSVSARMRQYGAMRAVGMNEHQISKMFIAEALTYALGGYIVGCGLGLGLSKLLYAFLITEHFPYAVWSLPVGSLCIILLFVLFASTIATYTSARRMRMCSVTETIKEL